MASARGGCRPTPRLMRLEACGAKVLAPDEAVWRVALCKQPLKAGDRAPAIDPAATCAAVNSSPRSGRSRTHRGLGRCPRNGGHPLIVGTGARQGDRVAAASSLRSSSQQVSGGQVNRAAGIGCASSFSAPGFGVRSPGKTHRRSPRMAPFWAVVGPQQAAVEPKQHTGGHSRALPGGFGRNSAFEFLMPNSSVASAALLSESCAPRQTASGLSITLAHSTLVKKNHHGLTAKPARESSSVTIWVPPHNSRATEPAAARLTR